MNFVSLVAGLVVVCAGMFEAGLAIGHQRIIPAVVAAVLIPAGIVVVVATIKDYAAKS